MDPEGPAEAPLEWEPLLEAPSALKSHRNKLVPSQSVEHPGDSNRSQRMM